MKSGKPPKLTRKPEMSLVRSSAAEYLTFVAASGQGGVEAVYADESIWLTQKMMGVLYDVETQTINYHLKKVFGDSELEESSVIRKFRITAADDINYGTGHYNSSAIVQDRLFVSDFNAELMRIARNNEESRNEEGGVE